MLSPGTQGPAPVRRFTSRFVPPGIWILIASMASLICLAVPAHAGVSREGGLITAFRAELAPRKLPRKTRAPISVHVDGSFRTADHAPRPQLRTISIAINRAGRIDAAGLMAYRAATVRSANPAAARRLCGRALVGTGHVTLETHLPSQEPFTARGNLLAFNGPLEHGLRTILAQIYVGNPSAGIRPPVQAPRRTGTARHGDDGFPAGLDPRLGLSQSFRHDVAPGLPVPRHGAFLRLGGLRGAPRLPRCRVPARPGDLWVCRRPSRSGDHREQLQGRSGSLRGAPAFTGQLMFSKALRGPRESVRGVASRRGVPCTCRGRKSASRSFSEFSVFSP